MNYPKMILFDYGHTLLYEPDWDSARGNAALMNYVTNNPNNCTLDDIGKAAPSSKTLPQCRHLHIQEWKELIAVLEELDA